MTQELACLLIGLAMWIIGGLAWRYAATHHHDATCGPIATIAGLLGFALIFYAVLGHISSLPSIKEVGR